MGDLSGIASVANNSPLVRFCEGRDGHTDTDYPIILELCQIAGSLHDLVSLNINCCHAADNDFLAPIITAPGLKWLNMTDLYGGQYGNETFIDSQKFVGKMLRAFRSGPRPT